ncbi:hypothetical protein [Chelativorans intermedius]|uniref:Uncharacterized protein n=1 Tax=Chelativorans intermedius TaxID=515947 RepID=A0ABV6D960_9HYPH|nr:hypothetical protein [Chelativorans intermedius]MCT8999956.1 hypothetical protein [Chelativorans intermedius]
MVQIFLRLTTTLRRRGQQLEAVEDHTREQEPWCRDPLLHPDIAAMSPREQADLPLRGTHACRC